MELSKNIKELRQLNNMTQEKLAKKLNMSAQNISKWEQDLSEPSVSDCMKMAKIFNVSINDLLKENAVSERDVQHNKSLNYLKQVTSFAYSDFPNVSLKLECFFKKNHDKEEIEKIIGYKTLISYSKTEVIENHPKDREGHEKYKGFQNFEFLTINLRNKEENRNQALKHLKENFINITNELYTKKEEIKRIIEKYDGELSLCCDVQHNFCPADMIILTPEISKKLGEMNIEFIYVNSVNFCKLKEFLNTITID